MSGSARITTIDAVDALAAALFRFAEEVRAALDEARMGTHHVVQWVQHDQREYWDVAARRAAEQVTEAKINLDRARMVRTVGDHRPVCQEEKDMLEATKRRLAFAKEKIEIVRRWGRILDQEVDDYEASVSQLTHWLESDCPKALAAMERMTRALEKYTETVAAANETSAQPQPSSLEDAPNASAAEPSAGDTPPGGPDARGRD
ncbi:MAG: hypothetical protein ACLQNE_33225 [Thermoguttaceae bacterium]